MALEVNKHRVNTQYNNFDHPRVFIEGDLVLLWDQPKEPLGEGKFNPMWCGPYMVKHAYELVDYKGMTLVKPRNGLYIKKYYA